MRTVFGLLVLAGLTASMLGCGGSDKPGAATIPTGMMPTPKEGPRAAAGGGGGAGNVEPAK